MAEKILCKKEICEQGLKNRLSLRINPPPSDDRCQCCRKHISQLEPFEDLLFGGPEEEFLLKVFRPMGPYNCEAESACEDAESNYEKAGFRDPLEWLIEKFGEELGQNFYFASAAWNQIGAFWLCTKCITLSLEEYYSGHH